MKNADRSLMVTSTMEISREQAQCWHRDWNYRDCSIHVNTRISMIETHDLPTRHLAAAVPSVCLTKMGPNWYHGGFAAVASKQLWPRPELIQGLYLKLSWRTIASLTTPIYWASNKICLVHTNLSKDQFPCSFIFLIRGKARFKWGLSQFSSKAYSDTK